MNRFKTNLVSSAASYVQNGWVVLPITKGTKKPIGSGWNKLRLQEHELEQAFQQAGGVGIHLGPSGLAEIGRAHV